MASNFARDNAEDVAYAASSGYISTWSPAGWGRKWSLTKKGLQLLEEAQ